MSQSSSSHRAGQPWDVLQELQTQLSQLKGQLKGLAQVRKSLQEFMRAPEGGPEPSPGHPVMVALSGKGFLRARVQPLTSHVTVDLGQGWLVQASFQEALDILQRRRKRARKMYERVAWQLRKAEEVKPGTLHPSPHQHQQQRNTASSSSRRKHTRTLRKWLEAADKELSQRNEALYSQESATSTTTATMSSSASSTPPSSSDVAAALEEHLPLATLERGAEEGGRTVQGAPGKLFSRGKLVPSESLGLGEEEKGQGDGGEEEELEVFEIREEVPDEEELPSRHLRSSTPGMSSSSQPTLDKPAQPRLEASGENPVQGLVPSYFPRIDGHSRTAFASFDEFWETLGEVQHLQTENGENFGAPDAFWDDLERQEADYFARLERGETIDPSEWEAADPAATSTEAAAPAGASGAAAVTSSAEDSTIAAPPPTEATVSEEEKKKDNEFQVFQNPIMQSVVVEKEDEDEFSSSSSSSSSSEDDEGDEEEDSDLEDDLEEQEQEPRDRVAFPNFAGNPIRRLPTIELDTEEDTEEDNEEDPKVTLSTSDVGVTELPPVGTSWPKPILKAPGSPRQGRRIQFGDNVTRVMGAEKDPHRLRLYRSVRVSPSSFNFSYDVDDSSSSSEEEEDSETSDGSSSGPEEDDWDVWERAEAEAEKEAGKKKNGKPKSNTEKQHSGQASSTGVKAICSIRPEDILVAEAGGSEDDTSDSSSSGDEGDFNNGDDSDSGSDHEGDDEDDSDSDDFSKDAVQADFSAPKPVSQPKKMSRFMARRQQQQKQMEEAER